MSMDYLSAWMQQRSGDSLTGLSGARAAYSAELSDPRIRNALLALTHAEVGGQGPQAQQAFIESVMNRAAARGKSLADTIYDRNYFPAITHQRIGSGVPAQHAPGYNRILDAVVGGSNISNYATGNASGTVGFAGGPQTFAANGERFGIEGPDRAWSRRMAGGQDAAHQPVPQRPAGVMALGGPSPAEAFRNVQPDQAGTQSNSLMSGWKPARWEQSALGLAPIYQSDNDSNALMVRRP